MMSPLNQFADPHLAWRLSPHHSIRHYLLWSTKELSTDELSQQVADFVDTEQYVYFVNPPHLRSVRKVWHAHVLFKIEGE